MDSADSIEFAAAWRSAEALLPENWELELSVGRHGRSDIYTAVATYTYPLRHYREHVGKARYVPFEMAHAANPTNALWELADLLRARPS